jgi:ribonuclease/clavin/mitogillin
LLREALGTDSDQAVTDIVLTHWHGDHWKGLPGVLDLLGEMYPSSEAPRIHKFPCPEQDGPILDALASSRFTRSSPEQSFHALEDTQRLHPSLQVLHTPGHTTDSICLLYNSTSLFTADTVLGQGTTVFEDLSSYINSLERTADVLEREVDEKARLLPGHGPVIEDGVPKLREYVAHRAERECQVLDALARAAGGLTVEG